MKGQTFFHTITKPPVEAVPGGTGGSWSFDESLSAVARPPCLELHVEDAYSVASLRKALSEHANAIQLGSDKPILERTPTFKSVSVFVMRAADNGIGEDALASARGILSGLIISVVMLWPIIVTSVYLLVRGR